MGNNRPTKHHYVPAYFLAGFTREGEQHSRFYTVDLARRKVRPSTPRTDGFRNGYYRVDVPAVDTNAIETLMARDADDLIAPVLRTIIQTDTLPTDDRGHGTLLSLLGLLFARVPKMRAQAEAQWHERITAFERERVSGSYEAFQQASQKVGHDHSREAYVEYLADAKELAESGARWTIDSATIVMNELKLAAQVTDLFWDRYWTLLISDAGDFICSDTPVVRIGGVDLHSPETSVYVPLSRRHAVLGLLPGAGIGPNLTATREIVACYNSESARHSHEMFWAPTPEFPIVGPDGRVLSGARELLDAIAERADEQPTNS